MLREAGLYILDEFLGGVDPAIRDYILDIILNNFNEGASVIISTYLIADIERILDEVIFMENSFVINLIGQICSGVVISMMVSVLINNLTRSWVRFKQNLCKDESYLTLYITNIKYI